MVQVTSNDRLSNTTFHQRCRGGQGYWWLRRNGGDFVDLPERVRGDSTFSMSLDLPPGRYVLGVGPDSKFGVRQTVVVKG